MEWKLRTATSIEVKPQKEQFLYAGSKLYSLRCSLITQSYGLKVQLFVMMICLDRGAA